MNSNSRTVNSIRNISIGFLGQFIQVILGFINRTIFIKFLAAEYLGVSSLFGNILAILSLTELGVGSAIIYALYKPLADRDENQISALMHFYAKAYQIIGLIVIIVGLGILPFLNIIIKEMPDIQESIYVIYFFYLFNTAITYFFSYKNSLIVADQKNYISSLVSYVVSFLQTCLQIIVLVLTKNFLFYLSIQTICSLLYNIIISNIADKMYPYLKERRNNLDFVTKKSLIKNIKSLMIVKLSGVLVNNTDNLIITYFSGLKTVGLSTNYTMLIGIINTVFSQLFGGLTASVGNLNAKEGNEKKEEFFNIINFSNFWLFGCSTIYIILFLSDIIEIWIGHEFVLDKSIPFILGVNFYMVGMQNAVWTYKNTLGLFTQGRYLILVTAFINLILSMILGSMWGLFGILFSTTIARLLTNIWYDPYVVFKYGLDRDPKKYFYKYIKYLFILIITLYITAYTCNFIKVNGIFMLILKIGLGVLISNIIFLLCFFNSKELSYFKKLLISFRKMG